MNLNRIVSMIVNQLIRRAVNVAVDRGLRFASRKSASAGKIKPDPSQPAQIAAPEDRAKDAHLQSLAKQAAKAARLNQRIGR